MLSFDIPYIKLIFSLRMLEDTALPEEKVSALRGGMGEMLLRQHCVADRSCASCRFEKGCVVRSAFYSRMDTQPSYVTGQESVGYLIECEDHRTDFAEGDVLPFRLVLFGDSVSYFYIYLQAFAQLGMEGLGKRKARYQVEEVRDAGRLRILKGAGIDMGAYRISTVGAYVQGRLRQLEREEGSWRLRFLTPLSMKYRGEYLREFQPEALVQGACRRLQMLDYYVGYEAELPKPGDYPLAASQRAEACQVGRYSSTQDTRMALHGIRGELRFCTMPEDSLRYLLAGELLHIGKNTSFGFGKYRLEKGQGRE